MKLNFIEVFDVTGHHPPTSEEITTEIKSLEVTQRQKKFLSWLNIVINGGNVKLSQRLNPFKISLTIQVNARSWLH
jgi:hypothetical protein